MKLENKINWENLDKSCFSKELEEKFQDRIIKPAFCSKPSMFKFEYAEGLANSLKIEKNQRYYVIVGGTFIFGDFLEAMCYKNDWLLKKCTISTLSYNEDNVGSLLNLLNGDYIRELNLIVSDYFYSHERNKIIKYTYEKLDNIENSKFQLAVCGTHCKTICFETECGLKVTIHGSSNLRSSGSIEQFMIEESSELYDFNQEYQDVIIEKYQTINKSVRGKSLFKLIKGD